MNTYRVWMKDGYASIHNAETESDARKEAVEMAKKNIAGIAMSPHEKRLAVTVDYVDKLNSD